MIERKRKRENKHACIQICIHIEWEKRESDASEEIVQIKMKIRKVVKGKEEVLTRFKSNPEWAHTKKNAVKKKMKKREIRLPKICEAWIVDFIVPAERMGYVMVLVSVRVCLLCTYSHLNAQIWKQSDRETGTHWFSKDSLFFLIKWMPFMLKSKRLTSLPPK